MSDSGVLEKAKLDVQYMDGAAMRWIDVAVRHPAGGAAASVAAAARRNGEVARAAERKTHDRYPGPAPTAFVVEMMGRVGVEGR
eukprot:4513748-Alexandrium_andersonii.AAC.1